MADQRKLSLYWKCQLIGWSAASLYWGVSGYIGTNFSLTLAIIHFVLDVSMYICLSHLFRNFSRTNKWHQLKTGPLVIRLVPVVIILGILFMFITIGKSYLVRKIFEHGFNEDYLSILKSSALVTFVTGVRLMAIWLLAYYFYHFSQREVQVIKENARLALVAKDAQLDNLTSQINPHFFFNSLNNIKALVSENPESARRAIDLLSELLRVSLYKRDAITITLKDELAMVSDYLELEKLRFENRLTANIHSNKDLDNTLVPPLSIQSLVENAIKHGISMRKEGGTIYINIEKQQQYLIASVTNPGKLNGNTHTGIGLRNLKERLQLQYNDRASFEISDDAGMVTATIKIPIT